jgi:asparagine synthase (glutamine-hydrolysing)
MCGIAGFCNPRLRAGKAELERVVSRMAKALRHRGPDDQGVWVDAEAGVALGHRRLAILDLSAEGHQPMQSADGRFVAVFNGEIYNFQVLRQELSGLGHAFRGHSDTEVLLAAFCEWGIRPTLQRCVGMFALAVWDRQLRLLHLMRDRVGEKPLYYGWAGEAFVFGSELKALRAYPHWRAGIDRRAVALVARYGYIPAPLCIYENVYKLLPGCILTLTESQLQSRRTAEPEPYWSLKEVAEAGVARPFKGTERDAAEHLHSLLLEAVRQQMVADVPLGAFLSGGIDSSLVVALMQAQSPRPVKTFSIGFLSEVLDEAPFAEAVARHLGTDHTEFYVMPEELQYVIPRLPGIYDEPFADASQIPTLVLCQLARSKVTVSLSGDAGDELFGGYESYRKTQSMWPPIRHIPRAVRCGVARGLESSAAWALELPVRPRAARRFLGRMANLSDLLPAPSDHALFRLLMSPNRDPLPWLSCKEEPATRLDDASLWGAFPDLLHRMMCLDAVTYLPDDILVKVDRAAMSVSLETRIPLLDHRIIEFAWSLPNSLKQRGGCGKWLLRQVLDRHVPRGLVERPKQGFATPIAGWLRGPLRQWAEELLCGPRMRREGFFDEKTVRAKWIDHLKGKRDWGQPLWHVLMFQAWLEQEGAGLPRVPEAAAPAEAPAERYSLCQP